MIINTYSYSDSYTDSRTHRFSSNSHQRYPMVRGSHMWNISEVHAPVRHLETFEEKFGKSAYPPIFFKLTPEVPYGERISPAKYFRGTRTRSASRDIWRKIRETMKQVDISPNFVWFQRNRSKTLFASITSSSGMTLYTSQGGAIFNSLQRTLHEAVQCKHCEEVSIAAKAHAFRFPDGN